MKTAQLIIFGAACMVALGCATVIVAAPYVFPREVEVRRDVATIPADNYEPKSEITAAPHIFAASSYYSPKGLVSFSIFRDWKGENRITCVEGGKFGLMSLKPIKSVAWADDGSSAIITTEVFTAKKEGEMFLQAHLFVKAGKWMAQFTAFKKDGAFIGVGGELKVSVWTVKAPGV